MQRPAWPRLERALLAADRVSAERVVDEYLGHQGLPDLIEQCVVPALVSIGTSWEQGDIGVAQVYLAGRLCDRIVSEHVQQSSSRPRDQMRLAIGVLHDAHVLGKTMVVHVLRSAGFGVADWGCRLAVDHVVDRALDELPDVLMLSALTLPAALDVRRIRDGLSRAGCGARLVVGGAPFRLDPGLACEVGADHVGTSAVDILAILARIEPSRALAPW